MSDRRDIVARLRAQVGDPVVAEVHGGLYALQDALARGRSARRLWLEAAQAIVDECAIAEGWEAEHSRVFDELLDAEKTIADLRTEIESLNHFLDVSRSLARCRLEEIDRLKAEKETP